MRTPSSVLGFQRTLRGKRFKTVRSQRPPVQKTSPQLRRGSSPPTTSMDPRAHFRRANNQILPSVKMDGSQQGNLIGRGKRIQKTRPFNPPTYQQTNQRAWSFSETRWWGGAIIVFPKITLLASVTPLTGAGNASTLGTDPTTAAPIHKTNGINQEQPSPEAIHSQPRLPATSQHLTQSEFPLVCGGGPGHRSYGSGKVPWRPAGQAGL